ncbi:SCP-2 sterol transfer family protein [Mycolicibacterium diernhoferi]|uniref:SCP-2 sterol transfer family protein n=1 Tax=Mycolicibacterium diernhoferi TaxID=1801 RepID=A0A1Q4HEU7_9MYCO|nr:SCP-2 sterol transfer family protein [Mycolicibacterium diernhoferi]OJZ66043.1 SCP-2 sterol transfer family protein [Mycolicibacterium diernhoferi]OPE55325.1 SCP-2 sterol transfer family protein [Mycolicibacterium diernhoferi]PEG54594.1 SCP-2 sterol transfer family protein [Mycolicibacterium diernhoferi]QYL23950.1 SCP-2 sterol transfer family protein [Mycolicibacterium diernhoferi]
MAESVSSLLRRSIGHLADELPASYRHVLDALGALVVGLEVDDERCTLRGGRRLEVTDDADDPTGIRVVTSRPAILAILDAAITLDDAIETGALNVRGALDDVLRAHDTLRAYVHAAVRAPSQPGLLDALRADTP